MRTHEIISLQDCNCENGRKDLRLECGLLVACIKDGSGPLVEHLVSCWNEHDDLQAKSELVDELVEALGDTIRIINPDRLMVDETKKLVEAKATLAKAKEAK